MRKTSLLAGAALLLGAYTATAAEDYTCATPPTCAELGYNQYSSSCTNSVKCPFDTTKVKCIPETPQVGHILYSDGTTSSTYNSSKTAVGVVIDTERRYAISLDQVSKRFGPGNNVHDMPLMTSSKWSAEISAINPDGRLNTHVLTTLYNNTKNYDAANYCKAYSKSGFYAGEWWLPSPYEITRIAIANNFNTINTGLGKVSGATKLSTGSNGYYWSSSIGESADKGTTASFSSPWVRPDLYTQTTLRPIRCFVSF